ncbi:hypothetical protein OPKNFCMD_0104 [Methylobacterium crusticola]|uniref:histidine kinase n=1 Tax=Methylobacterium crusticola TaxID=1697972 RepID=A0ABQ4QQ41_9HYPH|nr:PAS domain-containing sensor histidine kinase [Methylobacterium crusticola]GJD47398.1 hypothetical protein OPKNFCMD_0104 [Methylobacterium crusticola]
MSRHDADSARSSGLDPTARHIAIREDEANRLRALIRAGAGRAGAPRAGWAETAGLLGAAAPSRAAADWQARLATSEELNARLQASEAFTARLLAASRDRIQVLSLDGTVLWVSEGGHAAHETGPDDRVLGGSWLATWASPGDRTAAEVALAAARAGRTGRFRAPSPTARGTPGWWDVVVTPIQGTDGAPERLLAVARDVTEAQRAEEQQSLLMQEMAHRVKNTLALVQAVATQTLRNAGSIEEAAEAFGGRLLALSQAHDILIQGSWTAADLRDVVDGAVRPHAGVPDRFRIAGPALSLGPRAALTLALMLHELGTNAAKYGALSSPHGHVAVSWGTVPAGDGPGPGFRFRWEEVGGPPVAPPTRSGFGSRLIERSLVHSFGGRVSLRFPPGGAVLDLEAPLAAVQETTA